MGNALQRFIAATTGIRDPQVLADIERMMQTSVLHGSLDYCSREELVRCACVAARTWRIGTTAHER